MAFPVTAERYDEASALFNSDRRHRYMLRRSLRANPYDVRSICFVGLNPSTADASHDDPTVRRCATFSARWGYRTFTMLNVHSFVSTDPRGLSCEEASCEDDINLRYVQSYCEVADCVVACWGANAIQPAAVSVRDYVLSLATVRCFGQNKNGSPTHPLYLPSVSELVELR